MNAHILFVDDDEDDEALIRECLEQVHFTSFAFCPDTNAALDHLATLSNRELPDLIVSDLYSPSFEGLTFANTLWHDNRYTGIYVVIYAVTITEEMEEQLKLAGVTATFLKPRNMEELGYLVNRLIELAKEHHQQLSKEV
jgi:CheY-like chemotaxis protein